MSQDSNLNMQHSQQQYNSSQLMGQQRRPMIRSQSGSLPLAQANTQSHLQPQTIVHAATNSDCVIDQLENAFKACISPFVSEDASVGVTYQEEQRPSVENAILEFLDLARKTEAYFLKQRAETASKNPEMILQEDIEELESDLNRKKESIKQHLVKVKQWQTTLETMKQSGNNIDC